MKKYKNNLVEKIKRRLNKITRRILKKDVKDFLKRYKQYLLDGYTKEIDQGLLRNSAFVSNGKSLDKAIKLGKMHKKQWEHVSSTNNSDILMINDTDYSKAESSLKKFGYWVAPNKVASELLDEFEIAAEQELRRVYSLAESINIRDSKQNVLLKDREMVSLETDWCLKQRLTYLLASSTGVLNVVGRYLETVPILNLPDSWFSFPVDDLKSGSAQNWHVDCDRVKWIKVFVYITDVENENGPHSFISTTHKNWRIKTNNSRFLKESVAKKFESSEIQIFKAKRGTVIFEDTRGLHKGTPLSAGHRLILQLEFSTDSFGYIHPVFNVPNKFGEYMESFSFLFPPERYQLI